MIKNFKEKIAKKFERKINCFGDLTKEEKDKLLNEFLFIKIYESSSHKGMIYSFHDFIKMFLENPKFDREQFKKCETKIEAIEMLNNLILNYEDEIKRLKYLSYEFFAVNKDDIEGELFRESCKQEWDDFKKVIKEETDGDDKNGKETRKVNNTN
jgi:hypothetical protein